ncbi:TIGR03943 family putative permease subunit [Actinomadura geliboluensis]|uniref:TIGR03943 family putative permease subunit n=1 Tax=Actinomadura geliboluensis TaxID=882440 RepID=UPI00369286FC
MNRHAQSLLLITLGLAAVWITLPTGEYLNYVRPGFRIPLLTAAAVLIALGVAGLVRRPAPADHDDHGHDEHGHDDHGHDHSRGPRVAWLLGLPVLVIAVVAPPALGSYMASRGTGRAPAPPADSRQYGEIAVSVAPTQMSIGEYIGRAFQAQRGNPRALEGVRVRLTGFVTPRREGGWYLTRMKIACCAGDAVAFRVIVHGVPQPAADRWVQVTGTWRRPPAGTPPTDEQAMDATQTVPIPRPEQPYD